MIPISDDAVINRNIDKLAEDLSGHVSINSKPLSPQIHLINGAGRTQVLVVNGTRLYEISANIKDRLAFFLATNNETDIKNELVALGIDAPTFIDDTPLKSPPLYAISLAVAQNAIWAAAIATRSKVILVAERKACHWILLLDQ